MENDILISLNRLRDDELVARVKRLIGRDRAVTAELVAHLAELDTRDVHLREGYPSLFVYCRDALGLSDGEAYNRIEVARAARKFPVILEMLAAGSAHLTTVRLLAPHLTAANHREVLQSASGKRKAEVQEIVAALSPRPDVPASVRRLPKARSAPGQPVSTLDACPAARGESVSSGPSAAGHATSGAGDPARAVAQVVGPAAPGDGDARAAAPSSGPPSVMALSPDRYRLQVTISGETLEKLRLAKDMLGHALPSGDDASLVDRAFAALLAELARKKFADTSRPRPAGQKRPGRRTPSAAVKRAVWVRDLGRCAFVGTNGHRCRERRFVEFHHVDPYALGGEATVDGIQLRCRRHNDYEGRLYFGARRSRRELVPEQVRLSVAGSSS